MEIKQIVKEDLIPKQLIAKEKIKDQEQIKYAALINIAGLFIVALVSKFSNGAMIGAIIICSIPAIVFLFNAEKEAKRLKARYNAE